MEKHCCPVCGSPVGQDACPVCGWTEGLANVSWQLQPGTLLRGQFVTGRVLGQGYYGITYLAWDRKQERTVAIKEFFPLSEVDRNAARGANVRLISADAGEKFEVSRNCFLRDAMALAELSQVPGIVRVYDSFQENGTAYMVMEYVRGSSLGQYIRSAGGRLGAEETLRILKPILLSMDAVHQHGILHLDISPDNIILDPASGARLLNFCVKRGLDERILYRDGFHALELYQRHKQPIGPWSDKYSLCATIYFCLTGQMPPNVVSRVMGEAQPDWEHIPGLTDDQRRALQKGMSVAAKDRYPSVGELFRELFKESAPYIPVSLP